MKKLFLPLFLIASFFIVFMLMTNKARQAEQVVQAGTVHTENEKPNYLYLPSAGLTIGISQKASALTAAFEENQIVSDKPYNRAVLDVSKQQTKIDNTLQIGKRVIINYENSVYEFEIYEIVGKNALTQAGENLLTLHLADETCHARLIAVH
jgi:hypothetical protein